MSEEKKKKKISFKNFKKDKFLQTAALKFFKNRAMHDPKFLAGIMTSIINPYFKKITPHEFIYGYEENIPLLHQVTPHYGKMGKYAEKFNLRKTDMKEIFEKYMPEFKIDWIYTWFKKDHPALYAAMVNYPDREAMEKHVVHEIRNVAEDLLNNVLK